MKILFVTARFPYPPLKGDQVRAYHQLRLLSERHKITLLSFQSPDTGIEARQHVGQFCQNIVTIPFRRTESVLNVLRGVLGRYPLQTMLYYSPRMANTAKMLLDRGKVDLVHVQLARMAPYFENITSVPRVIDLIDSLSLNMRRRYERERGLLKLVAYFEWQRMQKYEKQVCDQYDQATIVSSADREVVGNQRNLHINANGVDLEQFPFVRANRTCNEIVFTGNMSYFPNIDAVSWFAEKVFPLIQQSLPDTLFYIVGANPHTTVRSLVGRSPAIFVTGFVANVRSYLAHSTVAIAPMQAGSGIQNKVLEAMACGTPVVATSRALGGLDVQKDEHMLVADEPATFADAVIRLLTDSQLQETLARNARMLVETRFSWEESVNNLEEVYRLAFVNHQYEY